MTRVRTAGRAARRGAIRIGISGWRYSPWRGVFYPKDLPQKDELRFASRQLPTIEINGTFYSLQRPSSFEHWAEDAPGDFVFAVKGPRFITHIRRLKDAEVPLANFFASGVLGLGSKLGPILWQLPPTFRFDAARIEAFLKLLPKDTAHAASLARRKADRPRSRPTVRGTGNHPLRHALEIRHTSFDDPEFVALLRKYRVALVCADAVEWPRLMDVTSDFVYCRLHGSEQLYTSGYTGKALDQWAKRVDHWTRGRDAPDGDRADDTSAPKRTTRDVYVYFDNDAKVRAPRDAQTLIGKLEDITGRKLEPKEATDPEERRATGRRATKAKGRLGSRSQEHRERARTAPHRRAATHRARAA